MLLARCWRRAEVVVMSFGRGWSQLSCGFSSLGMESRVLVTEKYFINKLDRCAQPAVKKRFL